MREILFRGFAPDENGKDKVLVNGKWIKGKWVVGNLFVDDKGENYEILIGYTNYRISYKVVPETVGQDTGLTDKNGKKIFEGYILESHYDEKYPEDVCYELVLWDENGWCIKEGTHEPDHLTEETILKYSVVAGNIFENPELLEGE